MPFHNTDGLRIFKFESFSKSRVTQAIFTRRGGVSPVPWDSLNMGETVGDEVQRVVENRTLAFQALRRDPASMYDVWQVHSSRIVCTNSPRPVGASHLKADAILTDNPNVTLFMRFADCVPIFLFDPEQNIIGLVHSGWKGTVKKISILAVEAMIKNYNSKPEDIKAGIGPSISHQHYTIRHDVIQQVLSAFGQNEAKVLSKEKGDVKFDLWEANRILLLQAGLKEIEVSNICTASNPSDWYSYRGEGGNTGRFGALIGLKN
jgi:YfiH family protein